MRKRAWTPPALLMLIALAVIGLAPHLNSRSIPTGESRAKHDDKNVALPPRSDASDLQIETDKGNPLGSAPRDASSSRAGVAHPLPALPAIAHADSYFPSSRVDGAAPESSAAELTVRLKIAAARAAVERNFVIDPGVIETALTVGTTRIIFGDPDGSATAQLAARNTPQLREFPLFSAGAATLDTESLVAFIEETGTLRIELDRVHRPSLAQSVPLIGADTLQMRGEDGDGFAIAILDTGIDQTHPVFDGRIVEEACFSAQDDCPNEDRSMFGPGAAAPCSFGGCGHGTHVAGIAAADDPDGLVTGIAPHASIIAIQIFSDVDGDLGAFSSDILAGMQHVLALSDFYAIASVNLSFGSGEHTEHCDASSAMFNAVRRLREVGIATVVASGNDGRTNALASPACLSNVISVGAINDSDTVSSFSNASENLALLAPGRSIRSASVGGGSSFSSGTSMATPHVAGAIAALREAYPNATVSEIENALALSGMPVFDDRNGLTFPRIRADEAHHILASATSESTEGAPPAPEPASEAEGAIATARPTSGGDGGNCGLVGIEPFLALGLIRATRRVKRRTR